MKKYFNILSVLILFAIGFLFLHSELDLFSPDHHYHGSHDFCDIVESAKPENPNIETFKLNTIDVQVVFMQVPEVLIRDYNSLQIFNSHKPFTDTDINILHSTFLI